MICKECGELLIDDSGVEGYCSGCVEEAERYLDAVLSEGKATSDDSKTEISCQHL